MSFSTTASVFSPNAFLNPGPAPTPPSHSNNNNNNQPNKLYFNDSSGSFSHSPSGSDSSSHLDSNNSSPPSSSANSPTTTNTTSPQKDDNRGRFIKHGWTSVKEDGSLRSFMWTKKYLVLRDTCLEFYRNEVSFFNIFSWFD